MLSLCLLKNNIVADVTSFISAARKNVMYMLPNPLPAANHIRIVTTLEGDVFITEKRKRPCVQYIARGMQYVIGHLCGLSKKVDNCHENNNININNINVHGQTQVSRGIAQLLSVE